MPRSDEDRLRLFSTRVGQALSRRAVTNGTIRAEFSMHFDVETGGTSLSEDLGDEEDVRSLLLEFRKFRSDKEDVHFLRIANIVERAIDDDELKAANRQNRQAWRRASEGDIAYEHFGQKPVAADWFDIVVNGGLFHDDEAKAETYEQLDDMTRMLAMHSVNALVINCLRVLHVQRNLIDHAFATNAFRFR